MSVLLVVPSILVSRQKVKFHRNKFESVYVKDIVVCLYVGGCSISNLVKPIK